MGKIKTHEDFIYKLNEINKNITIMSSFKNLTKDKVKCRCNICGYEWETYPNILLSGHGCKHCNKRKPIFKFEINDLITNNNRNLLILDRELKKYQYEKNGSTINKKYYKCKCLDCGYESWIEEYRLTEKYNDNCCACKKSLNKLIVGTNDIATLLPEIASLFKDKNEAKENTRGSKKLTTFICPDCGRELIKRIDSVCMHGLSCPCNDSWSYPNKIIYFLLEQLNISNYPEKTFSWSDNRKYDEYIEYDGKRIIVEMQGMQNYEKPIRANGRARTLEEEQKK